MLSSYLNGNAKATIRGMAAILIPTLFLGILSPMGIGEKGHLCFMTGRFLQQSGVISDGFLKDISLRLTTLDYLFVRLQRIMFRYNGSALRSGGFRCVFLVLGFTAVSKILS